MTISDKLRLVKNIVGTAFNSFIISIIAVMMFKKGHFVWLFVMFNLVGWNLVGQPAYNLLMVKM